MLHIDLHETTDTDETEFRPALAARDGKTFEPGTIPDGFYLVDDSGKILGSPAAARGVIQYPLAQLGLCTSMTNARYRITTEVYPDSDRE